MVPGTSSSLFLHLERGGALAGLNVDHDVANLRVGLKILGRDIDFFTGEDGVDSGQHAGLIAMDMQKAMLAGMFGERHFGEIDGADGGAVVAVSDQLLSDLQTDILLSFFRTAADVRSEQDIVHATQRRDELVACGFWLDGKYIHSGAG